ncbi:MAG: flagellar hook capping protein [Nitrospiraceae bacterium]|nr:flagellar hook capping protein [Nitrospiraceae bacterium]
MSAISSIANSAVSAGDISKIMQINGENLGKEDFLKLLVTQLKYQSPMEPMKNDEFVAELAQFSSLEGIQNLNDKFDKSVQSNALLAQSIGNSMATTLIGKNVKIQTNQFQLSEENGMEIHYNLPKTAESVSVEIYDDQGNLTATKTLSAKSAGDHVYQWNGEDKDGEPFAPGTYKVVVKGIDADKNETTASTYVVGEVESVRYSNGGAYLMVGGKMYGIGDVQEVLNK